MGSTFKDETLCSVYYKEGIMTPIQLLRGVLRLKDLRTTLVEELGEVPGQLVIPNSHAAVEGSLQDSERPRIEPLHD